jgi:hypothetical protein
LKPQIEFRHVLSELSVNRNDPCEVLRELISNSYDAGAKHIDYVPIKDQKGFGFLDDGSGLDAVAEVKGITPWAAFFSIGKSTKNKGDGIGYKCQGSKLCFACSRILVATTPGKPVGKWNYKVVDNPRSNLDVSLDITPQETADLPSILDAFFATPSADTASAVAHLKSKMAGLSGSGTLILIDQLDTEDFGKYFAIGARPEDAYVYNYVRFYSRHGDVRWITQAQGFTSGQRTQVAPATGSVSLTCYAGKKATAIPFGYPYLDTGKPDPGIKTPAQVARLRDGRFYARTAKSFSVGTEKFSVILAVDGNRRAHDEYGSLGRRGKGQARSGLRLSDHRGAFISVKGIKVCKYPELLLHLEGYEVLAEGESPSHYCLILDGSFDLVTNRNALTKSALDTLTKPEFLAQVRGFLDAFRKSNAVFAELLARLKRESSEVLLNEQIDLLETAKLDVKARERFRIKDAAGQQHLFLSPSPGEEYLVGILYSQLASMLPKSAGFEKYWRKVITFSTQGIDSLGLRDEASGNPLAPTNVCSIEYKHEFNNSGPFNHALAVVDYIVAWSVNVDESQPVRDTYTCFGKISKVSGNDFEWEISAIENSEGGQYPQTITVIDLRRLIPKTFETKFVTP